LAVEDAEAVAGCIDAPVVVVAVAGSASRRGTAQHVPQCMPERSVWRHGVVVD
jgi:hypothetical protein